MDPEESKRAKEDIVILEDDLFVSPGFYLFAVSCVERYRNSPIVSGISLHNLPFNGYNHFPFNPLQTNSDVYLMQIAYYNGQVYSNDMIERLLDWLSQNSTHPLDPNNMHRSLIELHMIKDEWFPLFTSYLVQSQSYFIFPYQAYATNFGELGTHFRHRSNRMQTNILIEQKPLNLPDLINIIRYDSFQEIEFASLYRLLPKDHELVIALQELNLKDVNIDIFGTKSKQNLNLPYTLSSRPSTNSVAGFGLRMISPLLNIIYAIEGAEITLSKTDDLKFHHAANREIFQKFYQLYGLETFEQSILSLLKQKIKRFFS